MRVSLLLLLLLSLTSLAQKGSSRFIQVKNDSSLVYIPDEKGNIIPDFSRVGFYHGKMDIPDVPVKKMVTPSDNDYLTIQKAIDEIGSMPVQKNGFRGALLIKAGTYYISETIALNKSGVVIRGEGNATRLIATKKEKHNLINIAGSGSIKEIPGTRIKITDDYVPVGAKSFTVSSAYGLKSGTRIILYRPATEKWIEDLQMNRIIERDGTQQWQVKEYNLVFERTITKVEGRKIFIDNPVVLALEKQYGGGEIYEYNFDGRLSNVGIENLCIESEYASDEDEDHGWNAVFFDKVENGWARNITSKYFAYSCVNLGRYAKNITVDSCQSFSPKSQITGGRRYSFNNDGQQNLVMNCFASEGRHDYVTGARVAGPNVFYNCKAEKTNADIGPHHRWAMGTLYDNIVTDGPINVQDRGNWGTGHGWPGVTQIIWNCTAEKAAVQSPWVNGKNYVIGFKGKKVEGRFKDRPDAEWEALNEKQVIPASLFLAQRKVAE